MTFKKNRNKIFFTKDSSEDLPSIIPSSTWIYLWSGQYIECVRSSSTTSQNSEGSPNLITTIWHLPYDMYHMTCTIWHVPYDIRYDHDLTPCITGNWSNVSKFLVNTICQWRKRLNKSTLSNKVRGKLIIFANHGIFLLYRIGYTFPVMPLFVKKALVLRTCHITMDVLL